MSLQNGSHRALIDTEEVYRAISVLTEQGQVVEVRALEASLQTHARYTETLGGYFDNGPDLIKAISPIRQAMGIYMTLQPCQPALLHRAYNKLISQKKESGTSDKHILHYRWLVIDSDPDRLAGISSTQAEHEQALAHSQTIRAALREQGWPEPVWADSGNGSHLLYRVALPVSDAPLMKRVLEGLAAQFSLPTVHVDVTLSNPARICKLYGTLACKGDNTPQRPHRLSRMLEVPSTLTVVERPLLEMIVAPEPSKPSSPPRMQSSPSERSAVALDLAAWIEEHQIETYGPEPYEGGTRWILKTCVWDTAHTDKSAVLIQFANGALSASCRHNGCVGKKWADFRVLFEPDAYQRKPPSPLLPEEAHTKLDEICAARDVEALYVFLPQLALLPLAQWAVLKTKIAVAFKSLPGFSLRMVEAFLAQERLLQERAQQRAHQGTSSFVEIQVSDVQLRDPGQAALEQLYAHNTPPALFQRGVTLVRVIVDGRTGAPGIEEVTDRHLRAHLTDIANFVALGLEGSPHGVFPPKEIAHYILSQRPLRVPPLKGITPIPVVRADGTILDTPGYDPLTHLYYHPSPDLAIPPISASPTEEERAQRWPCFKMRC